MARTALTTARAAADALDVIFNTTGMMIVAVVPDGVGMDHGREIARQHDAQNLAAVLREDGYSVRTDVVRRALGWVARYKGAYCSRSQQETLRRTARAEFVESRPAGTPTAGDDHVRGEGVRAARIAARLYAGAHHMAAPSYAARQAATRATIAAERAAREQDTLRRAAAVEPPARWVAGGEPTAADDERVARAAHRAMGTQPHGVDVVTTLESDAIGVTIYIDRERATAGQTPSVEPALHRALDVVRFYLGQAGYSSGTSTVPMRTTTFADTVRCSVTIYARPHRTA